MKSIAVRILVALAVVLISGLSPGIAAIDNVVVWKSVHTKAQIENTLQNGYGAVGAPAAMDDVIVWNSARTQSQIEDTLANGYGGARALGAIDDVIMWDGVRSEAQIVDTLQNGYGPAREFAAMDDVIVWDSVRTESQILDTLQNGYSSTTGMVMWWTFNNGANLIYDTIGSATKGVIKGSPTSLSTPTPGDASNLAASGFTSTNNWLVADTGRGGNWQMGTSDTTYEMWIRNPVLSSNKAVFFSLTATENGSGDNDDKRLWVNADGSLTMGEYGSVNGHRNITSGPLTWEANKWYQITVTVHGYDGRPTGNIFQEDVKVYRGVEGGSSLETVLNYVTDWPQYPGPGYPYMSIGAHPQGYYWTDSGSPGYLGGGSPYPGKLMWWKFNNGANLVYDTVSGATKGVVKGSPSSLSTPTPADTSNLAASGFTSTSNWLVTNTGRGQNYQDTTFEMWIRNPELSSNKAVIFSLTATENGGGDWDDKRLWVNGDGSLSMGEYGSVNWRRNITSGPLTWEANKWYQITITIHGYDGRTDPTPPDYVYQEDIKVYRGVEGGSSVQTVLDYVTDWPQYGAPGYPYMSVGAHTGGYYGDTAGSAGFLGGASPYPNKQMWWKFNDSADLVYDTITGATKGVVEGAPTSILTPTPFDSACDARAAAGFSSASNWLATDVWPEVVNDSGKAQTYEMWIRNPQLSSTAAVFWSITSTEITGPPWDNDEKRLWVNADGSLTMSDKNAWAPANHSSSALTWESNKWYQISVVISQIASSRQNVKIYRGAKGETSVTKVMDYDTTPSNWHYWMAVGAHPQGYRPDYEGKGGYLGGGTSNPDLAMWWSFDKAGALEYDEVSGGPKGVIKGSPSWLPTNSTGAGAASGFTSVDNWLVADTGLMWPSDKSYELWVRNPQMSSIPAVFWSLHGTEGGGDTYDRMRMWVDADGYLNVMDWGYYTRHQTLKSATPLAWDPNKWYQIAVTFDDYWYNTPPGKSPSYHEIKIYRGVEGGSTVDLVLNYEGSESGSENWMSIGAHPAVPYIYMPGGYLGLDTFYANPRVADLTITPAAGKYMTDQVATISGGTSGQVIYYTTDGSVPTTCSPIYTGGAITVDRFMTIRAVAKKAGFADSAVQATYVRAVEDPVINPGSGYLPMSAPVSITCSTAGAVVHYTIDGSTPTGASPVYTTPVTAATGLTVKAIAIKTGFADSSVVTATYTVDTSLRPITIPYSNSIVVDGNLSEWSESDFVSLDKLYWVPEDYPAYPISITEAKYAAKWGDNGHKVYVAVKINEPTPNYLGSGHVLLDAFSTWQGQDDVEIYIHPPVGGTVDYSTKQESAQQFIIGIKPSGTASWASMGGHTNADTTSPSVGLTRAVSVNGNWLYYEVAMTPWQYFGGLTAQPNVPVTLKTGDFLGLDVTAFDMLTPFDYAGMLSENSILGKSASYLSFAQHQLTGSPYANMSIANAKNAANGTGVEITTGVVSAAFTDYFYIETADRSCGMRVNKTGHGLSKGQVIISVTGQALTLDTGERYIAASDASASGSSIINPLGSDNRGLSGSGLPATGLLVKTWGKVTSLGSGIYKIDDGSGLDLRFQIVSGSFTVDPAKAYAVTGPLSLYKVPPTGPVVKLIIVKDAAADITAF